MDAYSQTQPKKRMSGSTEWQASAKCAGLHSTISFFPTKGEVSKPTKKFCIDCPVRMDCLRYALETDQSYGIWGGLNEYELGHIPRTSKRPLTDLVRICPQCMYVKVFYEKGAKLCDPCRGITTRGRAQSGFQPD